MTARYLLRLDDACPTMYAANWDRLELLFDELDIKPMVAVIPDNRDPALERQPADPEFWNKVRRWRDKGWTIAMHGYQHVLRPTSVKLVLPFYPHSEFAGLTFEAQSGMLKEAWGIFVEQGLHPDVWIAPAHCFERMTLAALAAETPIRMVSDGIARQPYFEGGFQWLPQQLWRLAPKRGGIWTVCLHPNTMTDADFQSLRRDLSGPYRGMISRVVDIVPTFRNKSWVDHVESMLFWQRHRWQRFRHRVKSLLHG